MTRVLVSLDLLKRLEWSVPVMWHSIPMGSCPECHASDDPIGPRPNPHAPDCELAAAIREAEADKGVTQCPNCDKPVAGGAAWKVHVPGPEFGTYTEVAYCSRQCSMNGRVEDRTAERIAEWLRDARSTGWMTEESPDVVAMSLAEAIERGDWRRK